MTPNEPIQHHQPRGIFSTWLGMVLLFALFAMIAFAVVRASPRGNSYEKKRAEVRTKKLEDAQKEYMTALTTYGWVDKTKGIARIPVTDAMQKMLVELPNKKPAAAGPIAAASPGAAPQTSPAASPATSPGASATASPAASTAASPSPTPKPSSVSGHDSEAHNQPAAAANPPAAPPGTQPGPNASTGPSAPPAPAKAPASPSPSPAPSAPGTPLPVRGKTP